MLGSSSTKSRRLRPLFSAIVPLSSQIRLPVPRRPSDRVSSNSRLDRLDPDNARAAKARVRGLPKESGAALHRGPHRRSAAGAPPRFLFFFPPPHAPVFPAPSFSSPPLLFHPRTVTPP